MLTTSSSQARETVPNFFQEIQSQAHRLLRSRALSGVPRQNHQEEEVRSNHHGIWQKFIDNLLSLFDIAGKVTTNGIKIHPGGNEDQVMIQNFIQSIAQLLGSI